MYLRNIYLVLAFVLSIKAFAQPTADGLYAHFQTTEGEFYCELDFVNAPVTVPLAKCIRALLIMKGLLFIV